MPPPGSEFADVDEAPTPSTIVEDSPEDRETPQPIEVESKAELLIGRLGHFRAVALLEDGAVVEAYVEPPEESELVGHVYVGRVQRYLPGMECAFVEVGLSRTAYLPTRRLMAGALGLLNPKLALSTSGCATVDANRELLHPGRAVLVQVERDPLGDKGARLTTDLGLAGRFGVFFPFGRGVGVSQRISEPSERERLRSLALKVARKMWQESPLGSDTLPAATPTETPSAQEADAGLDDSEAAGAGAGQGSAVASTANEVDSETPPSPADDDDPELAGVAWRGGYVVRTAAIGATEQDIEADFEGLIARWSHMAERAKKAAFDSGPVRVHREPSVVMRSLRELLGPQVASVLVEPADYDEVVSFVEQEMPSLVGCVQMFQESGSLLRSRGVRQAIDAALDRRVELPSGGFLLVEQTEALAVVDVNSGRFTSAADLRATALQTNLEAVREVARQLRLRNLGGIVVVDLIDMDVESDRKAVNAAFEAALRRDRAKLKVLPVSELGLVELTRQRLRPALAGALSLPCPACRGAASVRSGPWLAERVLEQLQQLAGPGARILHVEAPARVVEALRQVYAPELESIEARYGCTVQYRPFGEGGGDRFRVRTT